MYARLFRASLPLIATLEPSKRGLKQAKPFHQLKTCPGRLVGSVGSRDPGSAGWTSVSEPAEVVSSLQLYQFSRCWFQRLDGGAESQGEVHPIEAPFSPAVTTTRAPSTDIC